ncbi:ornithine cyclodeaminase family protein [Allostreptomyces psammosilenae]|uniref:Ornithine cyclodeaminase n=1 Tax=Allostreptomyces psammosilenae TaxID=1892865 RepID=A0A853A129_9ACTN|nr:ornithine cyclodeaminase family protein [Allostreptomyces psammosilenae]NYI08266.1 ornithine cyclodeaminase [Allostreptomyces psammosilenae]
MTLILSRSAVEAHLDVPAVLDALRAGFAAPPAGGVPAHRLRTDLPGPGTATCLMPGLLPDVPAYTVKVNAKFPAATPALRGVVCLHDLATGELLALLDSATVTAWRTGLAAALGTHLLADPAAGTVAVVGAGTQAAMTLRGLRALRRVDRVLAHDVDPARAAAFGTPLPDAAAAPRAADVVVLATWSRQPLLDAPDLRPGLHLTSLGADEPGKVELSAELLRAARVVVDDVELAARSGGPLGNVGLGAEAAAGTLSQVVRGSVPGRVGDGPTVYAPVGLPWQDLAVAWPVYLAARAAGDALAVDLLS